MNVRESYRDLTHWIACSSADWFAVVCKLKLFIHTGVQFIVSNCVEESVVISENAQCDALGAICSQCMLYMLVWYISRHAQEKLHVYCYSSIITTGCMCTDVYFDTIFMGYTLHMQQISELLTIPQPAASSMSVIQGCIMCMTLQHTAQCCRETHP